MSRARELAKVGGKNQQIIAGLSSHVGISTFAGNVFMYSNLEVTGTTTFNGGTLTLGDATSDNIVFGGEVDSNIIPDDDNSFDLGSSSKEWKDIFIDGTANIDSLVADTADIDGGTVDGATIGANSASSGAFTTLTASGNVDLGNATSDTITATGRFDSDLVPSSDGARDLGTSSLEWQDLFIDGTAHIDTLDVDANAGIIGDLTLTGNADFNGDLDVDGTTDLDTTNIVGTLTVSGNVLPNANGTRDLGASGTRWANVYSSDLDLSNQAKGGNSIDGSWGSYLIEEGEDDLFLTNRRTGKKYKFLLQEI